MSISTEDRICGFLNQYLFRNVWNEPKREFRTNAKLRLVNKRATGTLRTRYDIISLPDSITPFVVYTMPLEQVANMNLNCSSWTKLSTFNASQLLDFQVYTSSGIWMWRDAIYIRETVVKNAYFVAIARPMMTKCLGSGADPSDMYVTKYYDSDLVDDSATTYYQVNKLAERYSVWQAIQSATVAFVNGKYAVPSSYDQLKVGDYVEVITDGNVVAKITIDTTEPAQYHTYISSEENEVRTIIHIPKSFGLSNQFVTWNTCDIYIRPKETITAEMSGVFLHKLNRSDYFHQLTHNDFSIDNSLLSEYKTYFGCEDLILTFHVRTHAKNNRVIRDVNYIDLLYLHNDNVIISFMLNQGPVAFDFWKADTLEDSIYGKSMYDTPDIFYPKTIDYYIDALGYNNVLSLICQRTYRFAISLYNRPACWKFPVPLLFSDSPLWAIVYRNGLKLNDTLVGCVRDDSYGMTVQVLDTEGEVITCENGDEFVIEFFENPTASDIVLTDLSSSNATVTLTTDDILVWKKGISGYARDINGNQVSTYSSEVLSSYGSLSQVSATSWSLVLSEDLYGEDIVIAAGNGMYKLVDRTFNVTFDDFTILSSGVLKVDIENDINYVGNTTYLVFLNGRTLTENLDYKVIRHTSGGNELFSEIVIQNVSWIEAENNHLEIYGIRGVLRGSATGFVSGSEVTAPGASPFWFDNLSVLAVDGKTITEINSVFGQVFVNSTGHRNGSPYWIRTLVSAGALAVMEAYHADNDTERLLALRDYFVDAAEPSAGLDLIPVSHAIYSVFTNAIFRDYLNGTISITYNSDPAVFMIQFSSYNWLKAHDIVFADLDWDYIDAYPAYHRSTTDDPNVHRMLQYLYRTALPSDAVKHRNKV